ncbi:hypothetical protein ACLB2K_020763 [Fragaria x ananassa]
MENGEEVELSLSDGWIFCTWKGNNPCNFTGFICGVVPVYNQDAVAGVNFNGRKLAGKWGGKERQLSLDGFLDQLPDLVFFHANSNNFTGQVPIGTSKLKYFFELDLSNNKLDGGFPYEVLSAPNLTFLDLRFNNYQGSVPPQVFLYKDIDVVFLNNNNFNEQIPDAVGSSTAHYLTFANNKFWGPIPRTIGNASKTLFEVLFLNNRLSGCLPMEIGKLNQATLFDVSCNQLTGPIPQSFACLTKMEILVLDNNQFYGAVPELVCKLPRLTNLSLANNYFTQVGPACRKLIKKGFLHVDNNCILDLKDQRPKSECASFFSKPRYCPNERSLLYIPCKGQYSGENSKKLEHRGQASAPLTYGTLRPHNP